MNNKRTFEYIRRKKQGAMGAVWDKVEKEGAEKNVIGWGKMGTEQERMGKRLMGLDGMGWEGMEYIEKISSKYLQNSTNKISKINNFYSTSNWIQIILI